MKQQAPDLNQKFPRSPKEKLDGIVHFARIIDKAQAKGAGLIGEYLYPCPLDQLFLAFFEVSADDFFEAVQGKRDEEISTWLRKNRVPHTNEAIVQWNKTFLNRQPADEAEQQHFLRQRNRIAAERRDVVTWVDLLDLDEGREVC